MRYLCIVIDVDLVAVVLREPLASQPKPRVDTNPLVRNGHAVILINLLVRDLKAFINHTMNATRARSAELSGELRISINPVIDCRASRHLGIIADG